MSPESLMLENFSDSGQAGMTKLDKPVFAGQARMTTYIYSA